MYASCCTKAPAKINLRLRITGRKCNGYHELSMVNVPLDFCDIVRMRSGEGVSPTVCFLPTSTVHLTDLPPEKNLAWQAARTFLDRYPLSFTPLIEIEKHVPMGGGLGGGSSDAGAVLRLLAFAWKQSNGEEIGADSLIELGTAIGADVPFFVLSEPAIVTGIGEKIQPFEIPDLPLYEILLVFPPFGTSTVAMYEAYRRRFPVLDQGHDPLDPCTVSITPDLIRNDFEDVVGELYPELQELLLELREIEDLVFSLSGSGSTLFAVPKEGKSLPVDAEKRVAAVAVNFDASVRIARLAAVPEIDQVSS